MTDNAPLFPIPTAADEPRMKAHISNGNRKMGNIPNFSTLPSDDLILTKEGRPISGMKGTCSGVCSACKGDCYAVRIVKRYFMKDVINAWQENTWLMRNRPETVIDTVIAFCKKRKPKSFRINVSGEIEDIVTLKSWIVIATNCKDTNFYMYTKNTKVLAEHIGNGDARSAFPDNLHINISQWNNTVDNPWGLPEFVYDDHTDPEVMALPHCPAVNERGKSTGVHCDVCGRCANAKLGSKIAVHRH